MFKIYMELFISSFGVYRETLVDVSVTEGVLDLPNYVARIVKDNWTMEVYDPKLLKGHMHHQKRSL